MPRCPTGADGRAAEVRFSSVQAGLFPNLEPNFRFGSGKLPNFEPNFRFRFGRGSVQVRKRFELGSNSFFIQKAGIQSKCATTLKKTSNFDTGIRSK